MPVPAAKSTKKLIDTRNRDANDIGDSLREDLARLFATLRETPFESKTDLKRASEWETLREKACEAACACVDLANRDVRGSRDRRLLWVSNRLETDRQAILRTHLNGPFCLLMRRHTGDGLRIKDIWRVTTHKVEAAFSQALRKARIRTIALGHEPQVNRHAQKVDTKVSIRQGKPGQPDQVGAHARRRGRPRGDDVRLQRVNELKLQGNSCAQVARTVNKKFGLNLTKDAHRKQWDTGHGSASK
jgi:hypothetical protein